LFSLLQILISAVRKHSGRNTMQIIMLLPGSQKVCHLCERVQRRIGSHGDVVLALALALFGSNSV
jgi:hypothetical protein